MEYISVKEASLKWGLTPRRIQILCSKGRIFGAYKHAGVWFIQKDAQKPVKMKTGPKTGKQSY